MCIDHIITPNEIMELTVGVSRPETKAKREFQKAQDLTI
jgi:hypothetical protein